ncbi:MAG: hypothetical protein JSR17_01595 [Proteobacteria bacterium]|nr:hypothetical protein [Pseudomonadota bacterium]
MKCKYCNTSCKSIKRRKQKGGGWDPKKDAGIIVGHGNIEADKFIIIPDGIQLRPFSRLGEQFNLKHLIKAKGTWNEFKDEFKDKNGRSNIFNYEDHDFNVGQVYKAGDIIPEMNISMQLLWPEEEGGESKHDIDRGQIVYFPAAGVITERSIPEINVKIAKLNNRKQNIENIKNEIWGLSDPSIKLEWNRTYSLSTILKKIVDSGKQEPYWILACRSGDLVSEEIQCGKGIIRKSLTSSIDEYANIFKGFGDNIKILEHFVVKFASPSMEIIKKEFIDKFKDYIFEQKYNIDTDLLCTVQNIIIKGIIERETVNFTRNTSKTTFFKDFWIKYEPIRKDYQNELEAQTRVDQGIELTLKKPKHGSFNYANMFK